MALFSEILHQHMIAGCLKLDQPVSEEKIVEVLAQGGEEERFHLHHAWKDGCCYYLALPSRLMTHGTSFSTPLSIALPDHPQHLGDGIYHFTDAVCDKVVVKGPGEFFLLDKASESWSRLAEQHGLSVFRIEDGVLPNLLLSPEQQRRERFRRWSDSFNHKCRHLIIALCLVYGLIAVISVQGVSRWLNIYWLHAKAARDAVYKIQYTSPLIEKLSRFQQVSAVVIRSGGWINGYLWKKGDEAFDISLPGWISRDYLDALGPGTVADFSIPDNLVLARKGDIDQLSKQ